MKGSSNRQRAFSVVELMAVTLIIVILASLGFSAARSAMVSARASSSAERLHQMHLALMLYQGDWGGDGHYGDLYQMGLPHLGQLDALRLPRDIWRSPCGSHPDLGAGPATSNYIYFPSTPEFSPQFEHDAMEYRDKLVVWADMNCNSHDIRLNSSVFQKRGLGVLLGGSIVNKISRGNWNEFSWWSKRN